MPARKSGKNSEISLLLRLETKLQEVLSWGVGEFGTLLLVGKKFVVVDE